MNRKLPFALSSLCCCVAFSPLLPCRGAAPPASSAALDAAGQKLADDDLPGAVKNLQAVLQVQPGNPEALHLLAIIALSSGAHQKAMRLAQSALQQTGISQDERADLYLLEGTAGYGQFADDYHSLLSRQDLLNDSWSLMQDSDSQTQVLPTGDTISLPGDAGAGEDYSAMVSSYVADLVKLRATLTQAGNAFHDALAADPHLPGAHDGLGLIHVAEGYPGEARREFQTELSEHGPNGVVYMHLGELDVQENHQEDALANFQRAVALSPHLATPYDDLAALYTKQHDNERAQWARGMALLTRGDMTGAGKALAAASPKSCEMLCAQAKYAQAQKRQDDARHLLEKARALDAQNVSVLTSLGDLEQAQGNGDKAMAAYKEALAADPDCAAAWYGLGLVYDGRSDKASAVADYKQTLLVNPNHALARLNLAADEADLGQSAQAATDLRDYLQRFPTASNVYIVQTTLAHLTPS